MKLKGIPDQVVRIGILFAAAAAVVVYARQRFVPPSFGQLGHYRGDAIPKVAGQPIKYGGAEACAECHTEEAAKKNKSYHRGLSCEVCHGPAAAHMENPGERRPVVPKERRACLYCHEYLPSRPTGFPQVIERLHNPLEPCMSCHNPHDPTPPKVPEACSACHGMIARTKSISPHRSLDCETCHKADARHKENPRAFRPTKPAERDFCGRCHSKQAKGGPPAAPRVDLASHGGRYLCWQCHYPHFPEAR